MKICSKCNRKKSLKMFTTASHTKSGVYSWCKPCSLEYQRAVYRTLDGQLRHRVRAARGRAKRFRLAFDLDTAYLQELWNDQEGCCAVSGLPFVLDDEQDGKQAMRPSVDRVDPAKGYVRGNIRLVTTIVNFAINKWGHATFMQMCTAVVSNQRNEP